MQRFSARVSSRDEMYQQQQQLQSDQQRLDGEDDRHDGGINGGDGEEQEEDEEDEAAAVHARPSRRQHRLVSRLSLSELKALTDTPALVELHDTNSPDPRLLVALKAANNAVPVPPHWQAKRKYLANKRGYEKPPFALPSFLADTGIATMRGVQLAKDTDKTGKQRQRERMRPKMGAIDIDYNTLHDAFFRYQSKPPLTEQGELYYEGKEFETSMAQATPLHFSPQLLEALGMQAADAPPPWLSAMQRYGPPPAYPFLRVPGVNGPLPPGQRWGLADGEWGKPPVDEAGRALWGGELFGEAKHSSRETRLHQQHWGRIDKEMDDVDGEEGDDGQTESKTGQDEAEAEEDAEAAVEGGGALTGAQSSVLPAGGLSTPAAINLRKQADGAGTETPNTVHPAAAPQLFTVLEEQPVQRGAGLLPVSHTYHISSVDQQQSAAVAGTAAERLRRGAAGGVELALDPSELDGLDAQTLKRKYEQQQRQQQLQRQLQRSEDENNEEQPGSHIGKEMDETARKKRKKDAQQQHKFKF